MRSRVLAVLLLLCLVYVAPAAAQTPLRLKVFDSLNVEVGSYVGITIFQASLRMAVLRFDPATNLWVVFPVDIDELGLNVPRGRQIRFSTGDCSGTPFVLLGEGSGLGNPLTTPQLWGGGLGGVYYYGFGPKFTATEGSFQMFTTAGEVTTCTPTTGAPMFTNAYPVSILNLSGLFTPPFHVTEIP